MKKVKQFFKGMTSIEIIIIILISAVLCISLLSSNMCEEAVNKHVIHCLKTTDGDRITCEKQVRSEALQGLIKECPVPTRTTVIY